MCSISGFGSGAGAELPGYDLLVQAMGGLMSVTGPEPGHPTKVGVALVDVVTGLHAVYGILAALRHRDLTGEGQHVEVNLLSSLLSAMVNQSAAHVAAGVVPGHPRQRPSLDHAVRRLRDRRPAARARGGQRPPVPRAASASWSAPSLADDARFATNPERVANRDALRDLLERALSTRGADALVRRSHRRRRAVRTHQRPRGRRRPRVAARPRPGRARAGIERSRRSPTRCGCRRPRPATAPLPRRSGRRARTTWPGCCRERRRVRAAADGAGGGAHRAAPAARHRRARARRPGAPGGPRRAARGLARAAARGSQGARGRGAGRLPAPPRLRRGRAVGRRPPRGLPAARAARGRGHPRRRPAGSTTSCSRRSPRPPARSTGPVAAATWWR